MRVGAATYTGAWSPRPSCPYSFVPQAQRVPSCLTAIVWECPAATNSQVVPAICVSSYVYAFGALVPVPIWPKSFDPQAQSVLFFWIATVWLPPAATESHITFGLESTRTGLVLLL